MQNERIIKFRAWDGKRFHYWGYDILWKYAFTGSPNPMFPSTEYTGLLDKAGVEIYEGDILIADNNNDRFTVMYEDGSFVFKAERGVVLACSAIAINLTVIGNIYEGE